MKRLFFTLIIILLMSNLCKAQNNFYTMMDSLYQNDTNLSLPDSLKSGSAKNIDRINMIWSPRLAPHGDVSIAAQKITSYSQYFEEQINNKSGGQIPATWTAEGPIGNTNSGIVGNGQVNRITFDPKYNTMQNGVLNQTIYAGSFYGGLWRTENGGQNWSVVNTDDQLPQTSVSGIAVSHQNSNHIFISTGRGDGLKFLKNSQLGGEAMPIFTNGVYRSLNYGQTWEPINNGLLSHFSNGGTIRNIIVDASNANNLYIATTEGVFKSSNALSPTPSWTKLTVSTAPGISEDFKGLEQHPTTMNTVYAASNDIFKTTNGGSTWSSMTGPGTGLDLSSLAGNFIVERINLAVTPAAPDRLYAYINGNDTTAVHIDTNGDGVLEVVTGIRHKTAYIYMYKNGSWQQLKYADFGFKNGFKNLSKSWMGVAVSPVDPNIVYFSLTVVYGSNNITTQNFSLKSTYNGSGYHADTHVLEFEPNTPTNPKLFSANHGGVSVKNIQSSGASGWSFRNNGLNLALIWSFDVSKVNEDIKIMGRQDNGAHKYVNGNWTGLSGGDGYGAQIYNDHLGHKFVYNSNGSPNINLPFDAIQVSHGNNSGSRREAIAKQFQIHEHPVSGKAVFGFSELYTFPGQDRPTSVNNPSDWTIESDLYREDTYINSLGQYIFHWPGAKRIREFAIAKSNPNYTYLATYAHTYPPLETVLFRSTTGLKDGVYHDYNNPPLPPRTFLNINENPSSNIKSFITYNGQNYAPFITGIAVSPTNENEIWISVSGFTTNVRVLKSTDGGITWANADPTASLPEMPANNIVYQNGSNNRLYLATDVGVYVKDDAMGDWQRYGDIPNVRINELYIRYCNNKLYAGTYGRGIWSVDLIQGNDNLSFLEIDNNETWDNDRFADYSIKIKSGNTLTLTSKLYMPVNGRIIVEKGAKLVIDGGVITNNCGRFWGILEVRGDNTYDQSNLSNQGVLILKNGALIENAREVTIKDNNTWGAGGVIQATDATFRNCKRAVSFYSYPFHNTSFFKRCKFETTPDYVPLYNQEPNGPFPHVTLWDNRGVKFLGCEFVDNSGINEFDQYASSGIYSIDAAYFIGADCNTPYVTLPPCPAQYETRSTFKNFNFGVRALGSATNNAITVDQTDFENNSITTQIEALDQVRFSRNNILLGGLLKNNYQPGYTYQFGNRFFESSGYEVEENVFERNGSAAPTVGVNIINSGRVANEVYRNDFKNLAIGEKYDGINRHSSNSFVGLQFLCNTNSVDNEYDVVSDHFPLNSIPSPLITPTEGIRNFQGSVNVSAGNIFSPNPANAEGHIKNSTSQPIIYQYSSSADQPTNYTPSFVIPNLVSNSNNCPSNFWTLYKPGVIVKPDGAVNDFYNKLGQYNGLLYNYHQSINNGNTDSLKEAIGMYFPEDAQDLRDDLMNVAPDLSQAVLMDAAMTGILTDALLLEICLANPEATRDEAFLDFVEYEIPNPLSPNMVQLIYQNWDMETPRTLIEWQLADLSAEVGRLFNQLLHYYKTDTLTHVDSIYSMYNSINTLQSKFRLVEVAVAEGDFEAANSFLQDIQNEHDLPEALNEEYENFENYVAFREDVIASGKNILSLDEGDLGTLRDIAELKTGRASVMAQNILCFGYQECEVYPAEPMERKKRSRVYSDYSSNTTHPKTIKVNVSPNPADEQINLTFEGTSTRDELFIEIHTIEGKLVLNKKVSNQSESVNISNLDSGVYIYSIYLNDEKLNSDKLIIQH